MTDINHGYARTRSEYVVSPIQQRAARVRISQMEQMGQTVAPELRAIADAPLNEPKVLSYRSVPIFDQDRFDKEYLSIVESMVGTARAMEREAVESAMVDTPALSPQQLSVLIAYTVTDASLVTIARQLKMQPETMKTHLRRIKQKYAEVGRPAHTRIELYRRALEDGAIPSAG